MFSKSVVESDAFLDMPAEAQVLYFHLNMAADDYGFCGSPRSIMRKCAASNDSMKLLVAKKFVLTFEKNDNFVVVIKHWGLNNYIRGDRKHESKFKEYMRELFYDENGSYSMNPGDGHRPCLPSDSQMPGNCLPSDSQMPGNCHTEVRLGEVSIGEDSIEEDNNKSISSFDREKLISYWRDRITFYKRQGWKPPDYYYTQAAAAGITLEELEDE